MPSLREQLNVLLDSLPLEQAQQQSITAFREALPTPELRTAFDTLYIILTYPSDRTAAITP